MKKILLFLIVCFVAIPVSANNTFFVLDGGLGPELITNGDFSAWTDDDLDWWTETYVTAEDENDYVTEVAGTCRLVSTDQLVAIRRSSFLTVGKRYFFSITVSNVTGNAIQVSNNTWVYSITVPGTYSGYFTAVSSFFEIKRATSPVDATFDNVSLKEAY